MLLFAESHEPSPEDGAAAAEAAEAIAESWDQLENEEAARESSEETTSEVNGYLSLPFILISTFCIFRRRKNPEVKPKARRKLVLLLRFQTRSLHLLLKSFKNQRLSRRSRLANKFCTKRRKKLVNGF